MHNILNKENCPKDHKWFENGGICGFGHECKYCINNPDLSLAFRKLLDQKSSPPEFTKTVDNHFWELI